MKYIDLAGIRVSQVAQGCMRLERLNEKEAEELILSDLEHGINFFEHANIYGGGNCETLFGKVLKNNPGLREKIVLQTKCGIRPGQYDFSKDHILESVDASLARLGVDHVEFLALHRPDALMEPEEVAEAFEILKSSGKVAHFGVSNHNSLQMELLNRYLPEKLVVNQLQFGLGHTVMVDSGLNVNMKNEECVNRDDSVLDYCRLHGVTVQAWSPLQFGFIKGAFADNPDYDALNKKLEEMAAGYGITATGLAIAWILRHPARIQSVVGSVNVERMKQVAIAADTTITRKEWYELYCATGKTLP